MFLSSSFVYSVRKHCGIQTSTILATLKTEWNIAERLLSQLSSITEFFLKIKDIQLTKTLSFECYIRILINGRINSFILYS